MGSSTLTDLSEGRGLCGMGDASSRLPPCATQPIVCSGIAVGADFLPWGLQTQDLDRNSRGQVFRSFACRIDDFIATVVCAC